MRCTVPRRFFFAQIVLGDARKHPLPKIFSSPIKCLPSAVRASPTKSERASPRQHRNALRCRNSLVLGDLRRTDRNIRPLRDYSAASMRVSRIDSRPLPELSPRLEIRPDVLTVEKTVIRFRANGLMSGQAKQRMIQATAIQHPKQASGERRMPATPSRSQTTFPTRFERGGFSSGRIRTSVRPSEPVVSRDARNRSASGPIPAVRKSLGSCQIVQWRGAITWP